MSEPTDKRSPCAESAAPLRVLSLGAGVQSTTALLMSLCGELPRLDAAIFADTQREPQSVYRHLWWLAEQCAEAGVPLLNVTYGDLAQYALDPEARSGGLPYFIRNDDGSQGFIGRQCTQDFKVAVIHRTIKELLAATGRPSCEQWMGISLDEVRRMRRNKLDPVIVNEYPLIDKRMSRWDCELWMAAHGVSAPRSACYFCPFHSDDEWRRLRDHEPEEWTRAVEFDRAIRARPISKTLRGKPYLHRSMVPLDEVDLLTHNERGQGSLFESECAGVCGV